MIYIVEDDAAIRELEQYALQSSGYEVQSFESSEGFWQAMHAAEPELVILDVMLPGEDGFSILKKLRNTPSLRRLPIIMVTAKSSELDTVRGLDCGADDYITKPFGIMEFLSRVRAALRTNRYSSNPAGTFRAQDLTINYERRKVFVGEEEIKLTQTEYNIVAFLSEHAGRVMTYPAIVKAIWGDTDCGSTKKLQVNMANIRRKLGSRPGKNTYILNELGVGYRMIDEDRDSHTEEDA